MNKVSLLLAVLTALAASAGPAFAWDQAVGCSSRPGQRQQLPTVPITGTGKSVKFRTPTAEQRYVRDETMTLLMNVSLLTKKDVAVTSGYRSCAYTQKIRGRNLSQHTQGNAVDFKVEGYTNQQHFEICRRAGGKGCGLYCGNFGHIDLGRYRSWNHCGGKK
jgi:opacity protein-like surface antigen